MRRWTRSQVKEGTLGLNGFWHLIMIIVIIIYLLTARVFGAPQMISQPVSSIFPCPLAPRELQAWPVHFLMLSSHLFRCLPCPLPHFTVPCKMVLAKSDERETWPYHCSLRFFTMVRRSSCGPIACWILTQTSSLVTWSLYEMRSILRQHLISMGCILLWSSAMRVHNSQAYRKMDVTREHISRISELREILMSIQTGFSLVNAAVVCAILESISGSEPLSVITEPMYLKLVT